MHSIAAKIDEVVKGKEGNSSEVLYYSALHLKPSLGKVFGLEDFPQSLQAFNKGGNIGSSVKFDIYNLEKSEDVGGIIIDVVSKLRECTLSEVTIVLDAQRWKKSDTTTTTTTTTTNTICMILRSELKNTIIHAQGVRIVDSHLFHSYVDEACFICKSIIRHDPEKSASNGGLSLFSNGELEFSPGPGIGSNGGRNLTLCGEIGLEDISFLWVENLTHDLREYYSALNQYKSKAGFLKSIIALNAEVVNSTVESSLVGKHCVISGYSRVNNTTMLNHCKILGGVDVVSSLLQPRVTLDTKCTVKNSFLCDGVQIDLHALCVSSVIGSGTSVSQAEVNSCLVGPGVGLHHHSLLIATFWPGGRGNLGYGSNVGSNHTSRAPDQSLWCGEGVFFGLSSALKFPLNLTHAGYSIFATGVTYGPGKLVFPFSLISRDEKVASNRISPGWVYKSNAYLLERNAVKFAKRLKNTYASNPLRAGVMKTVLNALLVCKALLLEHTSEKKSGEDGKTRISRLEVTGEGAFVLLDDLQSAIDVYNEMMQLFSLRCMGKYFKTETAASQAVALVSVEQQQPLAFDYSNVGLLPSDLGEELQMSLFWLKTNSVTSNFKHLLIKAEESYCNKVGSSKARDLEKGNKIFPCNFYAMTSNSLESDPVIAHAKKRIEDAKNAAFC